jgi:hypothetical protein
MKKNTTLAILFTFLFPIFLTAQELKDEFKPSGKIVTQVFGDYYYVLKADTGVLSIPKTVLNKKTDANGFRFRRANLGYEYNFAQNFSSLIRIEADENSLTTGDEKTAIYLKDAFVKWSFTKKTDLYIGLQSTFSFEESEKTWGHRFIEKTIMDLRGAVSSRDFGVSIRGKINDKGSLFYNFMYANNSSLRPEKDKYKRLYANIGIRPIDAFCITAYGDYNFKEKINGIIKNELIGGLFFGLKKDKFSAGIESFLKITQNSFITSQDTADLYTPGLSVFGTYKFAKKWGSFARVDIWDNNIDVTRDARNYATAGITWAPINGFILSPNFQIETYERTITRTLNPSIWARLTFQWILK